MGIKKDILKETKDISDKIEVFTKESQYKIKKYDEIVKYLEDVKINVSKAAVVMDSNNGQACVEIEYNIPKIKTGLPFFFMFLVLSRTFLPTG